jgi:hypothetical protein
MKNFIINGTVLWLFLAFGYGLFAQQESTVKNLQIISESEKSEYLKLMAPHEQLILNNYDLKYHRFFWFINPAVTAISGSVTSYFIATQPTMNSIQFELFQGLSADSAYHGGVLYSVSHTGKVITVPLGSAINQGTLDSVTVFYHGTPSGAFKKVTHVEYRPYRHCLSLMMLAAGGLRKMTLLIKLILLMYLSLLPMEILWPAMGC